MQWCPKNKKENDINASEFDKEVFLTSVDEEYRANFIREYLQNEGIPVLIKYKGSGEYLKLYMGTTCFGIDIFVPFKSLEKAEVLLSELKQKMI